MSALFNHKVETLMNNIISHLDQYQSPSPSAQADPELEGAVLITGTPGLYAIAPLAAPLRISAGLPNGYVVHHSPVALLHPGTGGAMHATEVPTQALYSTRGAYAEGQVFDTGFPGLGYYLMLQTGNAGQPVDARPIAMDFRGYEMAQGYSIMLVKTGPIASGRLQAGTLVQLVGGRGRTVLCDISLAAAIEIVVTA